MGTAERASSAASASAGTLVADVIGCMVGSVATAFGVEVVVSPAP